MNLVHAPLAHADPGLPEVAVRADRQRLSKRLWRAAADDGTEFGFELERPLLDGDVVWATAKARYVIRQEPERVLEIPLDVSPKTAAALGWAVGNLHFEIDAQDARLLAPDDTGLRQSLDRLGIEYSEAVEVFRPQRLGGGHGHSHPHHHHHSVEEAEG